MAAPARAGFKCVEALGRIIIRGPYPLSNAIIYALTIVITTKYTCTGIYIYFYTL